MREKGKDAEPEFVAPVRCSRSLRFIDADIGFAVPILKRRASDSSLLAGAGIALENVGPATIRLGAFAFSRTGPCRRQLFVDILVTKFNCEA